MAAEFQRASAIEQKPAAIIVAQGKVLDFIDGVTQREETPEEYVRQEIAKSPVHEYHAACPNDKYGMWTNSLERLCYRVVILKGERKVEEIPDLPTFGREEEEAERPPFDQLKPATSSNLKKGKS